MALFGSDLAGNTINMTAFADFDKTLIINDRVRIGI
jgi:hypothetical protein